MRDYERRRSRDGDRGRVWDRDSRHERRESDDREERRHRDRSHSRETDRHRRSSHRHEAYESRGRWGEEADRDRRYLRDDHHDRRDGRGNSSSAARDAYLGNFAKGGKLFEDNGGLPVFNAGEIAAQQAQSMQQRTHDAQNSSQPWHQQQAAASYGQQDRWDDGNQQAYQADEQYNTYGNEQHQYGASAPGRYTDTSAAYGSNLEAGLDGDLEAQDDAAATFNDYYHSARAEMYGEEYDPLRDDDSDDDRGRGDGQRSSWQETPSCTIYVRGVPGDATEADFYTLLADKCMAKLCLAAAAYPGLVQVRVASNSRTGTTKGFAFVEFNTVDAAQALMESDARDNLSINGRALMLDYSISQYGSHDAQAGNLADWICTMCQAVNFARRLECHQCSTKRAADAARVDSQRAGPSDVLKVSGIEPQTTPEKLESLVAHVVAVKDVRLIRDKFTGQPRGFGFMEFHSVQDAARALQLLQNARVAGQQCVLKPSYAKQRAVAAGPVPAAVEAAQAMSAYSDWAPPQYQEDEQQAQPAAPAPALPQQATNAAGTGAAPVPEGQTAAENGAATSGFTYDSNSGYYYDPGSGYYYDANTGLYFDSSSQQWLALDPDTGQFSVPQPENAVSTAAESTVAAANAAVESAWVQQHSLADLQAPEIAYEVKAAPAKRRGAVIGSAAKLSSEGLMAAAKLARQKEEQKRAQEEDQKRREARLAAKKQQQQLLQQRQQQLRQMAAAAAAGQQPPANTVAAAPGGIVRGVIRSSGKWTKPADA